MTMQDVIDGLTRVAGVTAATITDYEGIVIEAQAAVGILDNERLSAWAAQMGSLAAHTAEAWDGGSLRVAAYESSMGSLMLADVGKGYLVVIGDPTVNVGMLRLEVDRAAEELKRLLSASFMSDDATERAATA